MKEETIKQLEYQNWSNSIVALIEKTKQQTLLKVNSDLLELYWRIGQAILDKQHTHSWGSMVVDMLSKDLTSSFPDNKGFSVRNLKYMRAFAEAYPHFPFVQVPLAQMSSNNEEFVQVSLAQITWYHHISLITKVKDPKERVFYIIETAQQGWSRDVMLMQIANKLYERNGKAINNFDYTLPPPQSDLARDLFKDPYKFDFLSMTERQTELDIERQLTNKITDFLIEMGKGFAFVGRQYHISVDGDDYYIDILMYHLKLHCYVVIELKAVEFIPEFVSKLNFYISAVDDTVKTDNDNPTIGLLLCRTKSNTKAKYALRGITQPLGIAQYETEKILNDVQSSLPTIEEIEEIMNLQTHNI